MKNRQKLSKKQQLSLSRSKQGLLYYSELCSQKSNKLIKQTQQTKSKAQFENLITNTMKDENI